MPQTLVFRSEAKSKGLKTYFTGKPCKRGHTSERFTASANCTECARLDPTGYRKSWSSENAHKIRAASSRYKAKDPEAYKTRRRAQYAAEPERHRQYALDYQKRHPGRVNARTNKRRAALLQATPAWLTREHLLEITMLYEEAARRVGEWHVDHDVPLQGKNVCGLHVPWNLVILTGDANRKKGNRYG